MSRSSAAAPAASSSIPKEVVTMARPIKIDRAPPSDYGPIYIKREGEPDIVIDKGRILLTVETEHLQTHRLIPGERWRVYRLFESEMSKRLVVSDEGHSTKEGEKTRYAATVCKNGAEAWEAMGKIEQLKPVLASLNWPAVESI